MASPLVMSTPLIHEIVPSEIWQLQTLQRTRTDPGSAIERQNQSSADSYPSKSPERLCLNSKPKDIDAEGVHEKEKKRKANSDAVTGSGCGQSDTARLDDDPTCRRMIKFRSTQFSKAHEMNALVFHLEDEINILDSELCSTLARKSLRLGTSAPNPQRRLYIRTGDGRCDRANQRDGGTGGLRAMKKIWSPEEVDNFIADYKKEAETLEASKEVWTTSERFTKRESQSESDGMAQLRESRSQLPITKKRPGILQKPKSKDVRNQKQDPWRRVNQSTQKTLDCNTDDWLT
ncbi:hypothetical protein FDENT_13953 [Fusarium denticulatum]|uniref:Uncharacterized protein n=1 Tax=Fusarium denticulatum TaxID=48507 RepID=A0A8H5WIJ2_9HYPO|nr:hypothetical protein FDENT_13953 [Fusarium denticulatum]